MTEVFAFWNAVGNITVKWEYYLSFIRCQKKNMAGFVGVCFVFHKIKNESQQLYWIEFGRWEMSYSVTIWVPYVDMVSF